MNRRGGLAARLNDAGALLDLDGGHVEEVPGVEPEQLRPVGRPEPVWCYESSEEGFEEDFFAGDPFVSEGAKGSF